MTILISNGIIFDIPESIEDKIISKADLEDKIIISARDGKDLDLIASFARGEFSPPLDNYKDIVGEAVYIAFLHDHYEVIRTIFESNEKCFDCMSEHIFGYNVIKDIHDQVVKTIESTSDLLPHDSSIA